MTKTFGVAVVNTYPKVGLLKSFGCRRCATQYMLLLSSERRHSLSNGWAYDISFPIHTLVE